MKTFINYTFLGLFINRVYSRLASPTLIPNLSDFRFIHSLKMKDSSYFSPSALSFNKSLKNPVADVIVVPVLSDNFSYILKDPPSHKALCVDPAEPAKVHQVAKNANLDLSLVLCTHKHWDHSSGNEGMKSLVPGLEVVGSSYEDTPGVTKPVKDDEVLSFGTLKILCLRACCHTRGHIMYFVYSPDNPEQQPVLFTGDTLFLAGCGRFFEGSARLMLDIVDRVKQLPANTLIYCGHEYTVKNLEFAYTVDKSHAVAEKLEWARQVVSAGAVTVPSLLSEELTYNPFMRAAELMASLGEASEEEAMAKLRRMKDRF